MRFRLPALALALVAAGRAAADDWPQFRGPTGDGHYRGPALPTEWGPDKNVAWKTAIPGHGWSSPVVWKGRVYLTTAVEKGDRYALLALGLNADDGRIAWQTEVFTEDAAAAPKPHTKNSRASPTPATDGTRLYVHFGHAGTAALDFDGKVLWRNDSLTYQPVHGNGGSPVVVGDKLIFNADGTDVQAVVALNAATGAVAWRTPRGTRARQPFSFATPHPITVDGRTQVVSPGSNLLAAYDPDTGRELWRVTFNGYSLIQRPVFAHGLVYGQTSFNSPALLAVKPGAGDVTATNVVWQARRAAPNTPSYLVVGDELYMVSDRGIATCLDAKTGTIHWSERLPGGACSASPITDGERIWITSEEGGGVVLAAGKTYKVLAQSELKERTFASFAAADGALYVRTEGQLYRFEKK